MFIGDLDIPAHIPSHLRTLIRKDENPMIPLYQRDSLVGKPRYSRISLSELNAILKEHQQWIHSKGKKGRRADLHQLDFKGYTPQRLDGKPGGGVRLQGAILSKVNIDACNFQGAYLQGANLEQAILRESIFWHARIKSAHLKKIAILDCKINNAYLQHSNLCESIIANSTLTSANCYKTIFNKSMINDSDFTKSKLKKAQFINSEIINALFIDTLSKDISFDNAKINNTKFDNALLLSSIFKNSDINMSTFVNANLEFSDFSSSKLTNVDLTNANLYGANLTNIILDNVNMSGVNLENIIIDASSRDRIPQNLIDRYGHTFHVHGLESLNKITRSIHFKPEHRQAGIGVLSYFSKILDEEYPNEDIRFKIEQNYPIVSLIIETPNGELITKIEKRLKEYGDMVTGHIAINKFTSDELQIIDIKNELRIAELRIESQAELLAYKEKEIEKLFCTINKSLECLPQKSVSLTQHITSTNGVNIAMGDEYEIHQAGSVGPSSSASEMKFSQNIFNSSIQINFSDLAHELLILKQTMSNEKDSLTNDESIENIEAARQAATEGNQKKIIFYLKKSGKWALEIAQKTGINLATSAIKSALGM